MKTQLSLQNTFRQKSSLATCNAAFLEACATGPDFLEKLKLFSAWYGLDHVLIMLSTVFIMSLNFKIGEYVSEVLIRFEIKTSLV